MIDLDDRKIVSNHQKDSHDNNNYIAKSFEKKGSIDFEVLDSVLDRGGYG